MRIAFQAITALLLTALAIVPVSAAPLAPEICANVKAEIAELEERGIRAAMARGAATAKTGLTVEQLAGVRRMLDLDAQSIFRCAQDRPYVALRDEPPEEKDVIEPEPGQPGVAVPTAVAAAAAAKAAATKTQPKKAAAVTPAVPRKNPPAAPVPAPDGAAPAQPAAATAAPPPKPKPKPKPAAKSDDAYRAPASGDPNATPLQNSAPKAQ